MMIYNSIRMVLYDDFDGCTCPYYLSLFMIYLTEKQIVTTKFSSHKTLSLSLSLLIANFFG